MPVDNHAEITSPELAEAIKEWLAERSCLMAVYDERTAQYRYPDEFPDHQGHYRITYEGDFDVLELAQFIIRKNEQPMSRIREIEAGVIAAMEKTVQLGYARQMPNLPDDVLSHDRIAALLLAMREGSMNIYLLNRCLGWAQAALVASGCATMIDIEEINRLHLFPLEN